MKLTKENAQFVRGIPGPGDPNEPAHLEYVETVAEANAIFFECPLPNCSHSVLVFFQPHGNAPPVNPNWRPKPRWQVSGTDLSNITLHPSINLDVSTEGCAECGGEKKPCPKHPTAGRKMWPPSCRWHGWVKNGDAA